MTEFERQTDIGPPHYEQFLPPIIKANYGKWDHHELLKPGVMVHVGETGDKLFTVRAGTPRLLAITTIREFADVADKKVRDDKTIDLVPGQPMVFGKETKRGIKIEGFETKLVAEEEASSWNPSSRIVFNVSRALGGTSTSCAGSLS